MSFSNNELESELLETAAGQAVYDALIQANIDVRTASLEMVKRMLVAEYRFRINVGGSDSEPLLAACP